MPFIPLLNDLSNLLFPRKCLICQGRLNTGEKHICLTCLNQLPRTMYHQWKGNYMEQLFYGTVPIDRATSYLYYSPQSPVHNILYSIKYYGEKELAIYMGRCMGTHLMDKNEDFLDGIDLLLPVPLAEERMRQRGYNQSQLLAEGISQVTGIPSDEQASLLRTVNNPTQTRLNKIERWENVKGIFNITPHGQRALEGKHILLIDDVSTTGATLTNCALTIHKAVPNCRISIATLAFARI